MIVGFKVLTHDYRPPVQGGDPVWDGKRRTLPRVELDTGDEECAAGWNFCADAHTALRIAGMWPDGNPSVLLRVRGSRDTVMRGNKLRCSRLTILGVCDENEVRAAVKELSEAFGEHAERMVDSQMLWRNALGRPLRDERAVEAGLREALAVRGLDWELRRFEDPRAAWAAWAEWDAWAEWGARAARAAWAEWDAWAEWGVWAARGARAAWDAWAAGAAWSARAALTVEYTALQHWIESDPLLLTTGLRDAYTNGLAIAVPVESNTLGWAMVGA